MNTKIANHAEQAEPVPAEAWALLHEALDYGQFSDDFDRPLPKSVRAAIRWVLSRTPPAPAADEQAEPVAQKSAEWERRFLSYDPSSDPAEAECDIPPHGWRCTRAKGHDGPCAAVAAPDDVALVRRSMARLAAAEQAVPAGYALVRTPITEEMHVAAAKVLARAHGLEGTPQRMLDAMIAAAPPTPARQEWQPLTQSHVDYVLQYGGRCRECADWNGICPSSGLPCGGAEKAVQYVLRALNYGFKHGYITAAPAEGGAA